MRRINKDSMLFANACRTRYAQLISGTAHIPCGIDDDPDARYAELEKWTLELSWGLLCWGGRESVGRSVAAGRRDVPGSLLQREVQFVAKTGPREPCHQNHFEPL
jgi:hypothetical protein